VGGEIRKLIVREHGQALVEMALILPVLLLLLMGIVQFGIIFSGQIAVASAAREGARIAAVGADDVEIALVVQNALEGSVFLENIKTEILPAGVRVFSQKVTVQIEASTKIVAPFLNLLLGERYDHSSKSIMRVEFVQEGP
jgi:Flp pilus assembly protein TadG